MDRSVSVSRARDREQIARILADIFPDLFIADLSGPARREDALAALAPLLAEERRAGAEQALRDAAEEIVRSQFINHAGYHIWLNERADQVAQGQP